VASRRNIASLPRLSTAIACHSVGKRCSSERHRQAGDRNTLQPCA